MHIFNFIFCWYRTPAHLALRLLELNQYRVQILAALFQYRTFFGGVSFLASGFLRTSNGRSMHTFGLLLSTLMHHWYFRVIFVFHKYLPFISFSFVCPPFRITVWVFSERILREKSLFLFCFYYFDIIFTTHI